MRDKATNQGIEMTDKQPEALRLACQLEAAYPHIHAGLAPAASAELRRLHAENEAMRSAIKKLHAAKGRYHTQIAACDLYDMCGLKNERPAK